jgi:hypothetical protein
MAGVYRPRHPERTVLYQVLSHHFDRFLTEYESRFEKEYGFLRPIVKDVVERLPSPAPEAPNAPTRARPPPRAWREPLTWPTDKPNLPRPRAHGANGIISPVVFVVFRKRRPAFTDICLLFQNAGIVFIVFSMSGRPLFAVIDCINSGPAFLKTVLVHNISDTEWLDVV